MVRLKTRWMIVDVDYTGDLSEVSKKDLSKCIHENLELCFGIAAVGADVQVRFWDPTAQLALIRVPREEYPRIRCAMTYTTSLNRRRVSLHVARVHGSARTAKAGLLREIRIEYRRRIGDDRHSPLIRTLEESLSQLQAIDY